MLGIGIRIVIPFLQQVLISKPVLHLKNSTNFNDFEQHKRLYLVYMILHFCIDGYVPLT